MATPLTNQATVNYQFAGGISSAVSNTTTTIIQDQFNLLVTKQVLEGNFTPGRSLTYVIRIENIGTSTMYNVQFSDNLGGLIWGYNPLYYRPTTLKLFVNSVEIPVSPITVSPFLSAISPVPLASGDVALFVYVVDVAYNLDPTVTEITNCVNICSNKGSSVGPVFVLDPADCTTVPIGSFANISVSKSASATTVNVGDILIYTITLSNSGNVPSTNTIITDVLPAGYVINSVSSITNGVVTIFNPGDYSLDIPTNTLTLPSVSGLVISVPAAIGYNPGITVVEIVGTVS